MAEILDFFKSSHEVYLAVIPLLAVLVKAISLSRYSSFERLFISEEKRILSLLSISLVYFLAYCALFSLIFLSQGKVMNSNNLFWISIVSAITIIIIFLASFVIAILYNFFICKNNFYYEIQEKGITKRRYIFESRLNNSVIISDSIIKKNRTYYRIINADEIKNEEIYIEHLWVKLGWQWQRIKSWIGLRV